MPTPAGWYPDPTGRHQNRWFDGDDWTDQVADGQAVSSDPVQAGPAAATQQQPTTPDPGTTAAIPVSPVAPGPPPGAPGAPVGTPGAPPGPPTGGAPLGTYASPSAGSGGGGSKTALIIGVVVVLVAVAVGLVLTIGGGDDGGGGEAADFSDPSDEPDDTTTTTEDDPSASDLFDDMADTGDGGDDIFGTDDEPADDPADSTVPPDDSSGSAYPQEVIDNFTSSCEAAGSPATFCGCVIDVLQRDVPYDRFVEIDQQLAEDSSVVPTELTDAAAECQ